MKKNLYLIMALMMAVFTFSACSDDDDEGVTQNPEKEVAGTYSGTWHMVQTNAAGEVMSESDATGTVVVATNRQWVVEIILNVAEPVITSEMRDVANCSGNSTNGYFMTNGVGATFGNYVARMVDNTFTLDFTQSVTEIVNNRPRNYTKTYAFTGKRVAE